jgi:alkylation response protein AidB-like acyl-CoA dehydrogenase
VGASGAQIPELLPEDQKETWKEKYVFPVVRAEGVGAGVITEPDAGSDTRAIKTTAVLDGDEWVINGTKAFCTNAGLDNCLCVMVLCLTDKEKMTFDTIIVPKGTPGFTVAPKYPKMGVRSAYTSELYFDDCRVPATYLSGPKGAGRRYMMRVGFAMGRIITTTCGIGVHQACLDECMSYAQQRMAFGRPIYAFQYVQGMLVDMYTDLEISRLLRDKAARLVDEGEAPLLEACTVKYWGCEAAVRATNSAVQIFGGLGYVDETPVSRYYRDVRWVTIGDGTSEIQKLVIAREIAGRARVLE